MDALKPCILVARVRGRRTASPAGVEYDHCVKILHVETGRRFYGGAQQVSYLIEGLADLGVDSTLVCRPRSEIAMRTHRCDVVELPMHGDCDVLTPTRLGRVLRGRSPDIVHVHSRSGADFYAGVAASRAHIPAVLTRRVDNPEPRLWARSKYGRYAALVGISRAIRGQLEGAAGSSLGRVHHISSAIDPLRFRPDPKARLRLRGELGIAANEYAIGAVGQLIPRKGHDILIDAFSTVLAREPRSRLLLVGEGPMRARLERQIAGERIADRVHMLGHRNDVDALLNAFDLFVHPARSEGLGLAVLEAMACKLPVIATRTGGLPDSIENGRNGLLVLPAHSVELARAILRVKASPAESARMADAAREHVLEECSIAEMSRRYLGVYESVLESDAHEH